MSWTWESWKIGRKIIHRNSSGRFAKDNFHAPEDWKQYGRTFSKEVREKISKTLKGMPFTEERKRNISKATKAANYKWSKGCKHGIVPISSCRECMNERLKNWRSKNREHCREWDRDYRNKRKGE